MGDEESTALNDADGATEPDFGGAGAARRHVLARGRGGRGMQAGMPAPGLCTPSCKVQQHAHWVALGSQPPGSQRLASSAASACGPARPPHPPAHAADDDASEIDMFEAITADDLDALHVRHARTGARHATCTWGMHRAQRMAGANAGWLGPGAAAGGAAALCGLAQLTHGVLLRWRVQDAIDRGDDLEATSSSGNTVL